MSASMSLKRCDCSDSAGYLGERAQNQQIRYGGPSGGRCERDEEIGDALLKIVVGTDTVARTPVLQANGRILNPC